MRSRSAVRGGACWCACLVWMGLAVATPVAQHPDDIGDAPTAEVCFTCHDDVKTAMAGTAHAAAQAGCVTCHDLAGQRNAPYLRAQPNALCLACHHVPPQPPGGAAPASVSLVPGYSVSAASLPKITRLSLDSRGVGHPIANHPVEGRPDPRRRDGTLTCLSCHLPHGGPSPKLLGFEVKPGQGICHHCHEM